MPSRSGMAALAAIAGGVWLAAATAAVADAPVSNKVRLQLRITGLSGQGCTVKIAPAHPGCQFKPIERRVASPGGERRVVVASGGGSMLPLETIELTASTTSADRDCSFAITIEEPGRPPQTFRRGVRLIPSAAGQPAPTQTVKVYLSAPSLAVARDEAGKTRR